MSIMISWHDAATIIESQDLAKLVRSEQQITNYNAAKAVMTSSHGGVAQFIRAERLRWKDITPNTPGKFLADPSDIKIISNDYSYNFEPGIYHLIVWSKVRCPCENEVPTPESRREIEHFITETFVRKYGCKREDVLWFKNTLALQSVQALEHFHILVRNLPPEVRNHIEGTSGYLDDIELVKH